MSQSQIVLKPTIDFYDSYFMNFLLDAQKSKRSLMGALAMADPPSLAGAGDPGVPSIDWRFSLGNPANTSHVNFTPQAPKGGYKRDNKGI